jgi:hypothetical protein
MLDTWEQATTRADPRTEQTMAAPTRRPLTWSPPTEPNRRPSLVVTIADLAPLSPSVFAVSDRELTAPQSGAMAVALLLWSTLLAFAVRELDTFLHYFFFDLLGLSAWLALLVGLELAAAAPARLDRAVKRLVVCHLPSGEPYDDLRCDLERAGRMSRLAPYSE